LAQKSHKYVKKLKEKGNLEKAVDINSKIEKFSIESCNNNIVLSTLTTPLRNAYTNYLKVGDELYDCNRETETETCSRMMNVLKLNVVPSRKNLITFIESNRIIDSCSKNVKELYELIEYESNPLMAAKKGLHALQSIQGSQYEPLIRKNLITKCLIKMTELYDSISLQRLEKIFPFADRQLIEELVSENSRIGLLNCTIDHATSIVSFKTQDSLRITLTEKMTDLVTSIQNIAGEILVQNRKKITTLNQILNNELRSHSDNGLKIYDSLVTGIENKLKELKVYSEKKSESKETEKTKRLEEITQKRKDAEENAKRQKELQKDEKLQKELDLQLKKHLIDRLQWYTNMIVVDGKKVKLEDLHKDLSKVKSDTLLKVLEEEEINFKTKKEKRFKELSKESDYVLREFRKRDQEIFLKEVHKEEEVYNKQQELTSKTKYDAGILLKDNLLSIQGLKEAWFNQQIQERTETYGVDINLWRDKLERKIHEDFEKEVYPYFKAYIEDFRKKLEEEKKRAPQQGSGRNMAGFGKGSNLIRIDDRPKTGIVTEFASKIYITFRGVKCCCNSRC
jgi:hypothetical protein